MGARQVVYKNRSPCAVIYIRLPKLGHCTIYDLGTGYGDRPGDENVVVDYGLHGSLHLRGGDVILRLTEGEDPLVVISRVENHAQRFHFIPSLSFEFCFLVLC